MAKRAVAVQNNDVAVLLAPAVYNTDQLSQAIDMRGFSEVQILAVVGNSADTLSGSVYIALELQDSDDNVTYAPVTDANTFRSVAGVATGTFAKIDAPAEDTAVFQTAYKGQKRYLKVNVNLVGTHTTGTPLCVLAIKSGGLRPSI